MRKRLFTPIPQGIQSQDEGWLDLDRAASVEVTSEEKDYGIEAALVSGKRGQAGLGYLQVNPPSETLFGRVLKNARMVSHSFRSE